MYVAHILVSISNGLNKEEISFDIFTHILHSVAEYARNWVDSMVYTVKLMINYMV